MVVSNEETSLHFEKLDHESDEDDDNTYLDFGVIIIEDLDDENLWASFGKKLEDFTMRDMRKLIFKSFDLCCEFYRMYEKLKGFGVREKSVSKSRADGHPTSKILKCSAKDLCLQKYMENCDRERKPKELT